MSEKLVFKMTRNELLAYAQEMTARHDWQKQQNEELVQQNIQLVRQNNAMLMGAAIKVATEMLIQAPGSNMDDCINTGLDFARRCRDILAATPEALMENAPAPSLDPPPDVLVPDATEGQQAN